MRMLIRASAGSGKTYQLSGHFLRQLFAGHAPESILATTFTRKAAGEILGRVLLRLSDAASSRQAARELARGLGVDSITQSEARRVLQQLTSQLHRMRICTLDSFFQQIARSLSLELGLPPGWSIIDEHHEAELRSRAIDAVLAEQVHDEAVELMLMLARGRHKRSVRSLINDSVEKFHDLYLQTTESAWQRIPPRQHVSSQRLEDCLAQLQQLAIPNEKPFGNVITADLERFRSSDWDKFLDTGLATKILNDDLVFSKKPIPVDLAAVYEPLLTHAREELLDRIRQQLKGIRGLMKRFDAEYSRLMAEQGSLRFADVTRTLARASIAADGATLQFRLDSTIRNLLLDEFQDTSPDQWQVLRRLTDRINEDGEASFFCVGDGKQAIYGWRGGEAGILDVVEAAVNDVESQPLDQSRRSSPVVIESVNHIFQHLDRHSNLGDKADGVVSFAAAFPEHSTAMSELPGYVCLRTGPALHASATSDAADSDATGTSADSAGDDGSSANPDQGRDWFCWAADQVRDLHRQCPTAEIGVLTRRKDSVARLVHELTLRGVTASEEGGTQPTDSPAALAIMSLLSLAANPSCTMSRYHVATSPLGPVAGLTAWNDNTLAARVAATIRATLVDDGYGRTLQAWADQIATVCTQRDLVRLQQIIAEGWRFDEQSSLNPSAFVDLLTLARFERSTSAPVRVMTIHQSKGLEFDVVVLPELQQDLIQTPGIAIGRSGPASPPDAVCPWVSQKRRRILPASLQAIFDDTIRRSVTENLCVLYVALTRARHALHLLIPPSTTKKLKASSAGLLVAALTEADEAPPSTCLWQSGDPDWFRSVKRLQGQPATVTAADQVRPGDIRLLPLPHGRRRGMPRRTPSRHDQTRLFLPSSSAAPRRTTSDRSAPRLDVDPRSKGKLIHAWFECIEWLDGDHPQPDDDLLLRRAVELTISVDVATTLLPAFRELLDGPVVRDVFDPAKQLKRLTQSSKHARGQLSLHRERSFLRMDSGEIVHGTIDRFVVLQAGDRAVAADIIDFKTDRLIGDVAIWEDEKRLDYAAQLSEYRAAVCDMFSLPATAVMSRLLLTESKTVIDA